ncbi:ABC transporter ATP-binding protein [soil metagenome]
MPLDGATEVNGRWQGRKRFVVTWGRPYHDSVRRLPDPPPARPAFSGPGAFLWWIAKGQWRSIVLGMVWGIVWMTAQAVMPALIGLAVDRGVAAQDTGALVMWAGAFFAVGVVQAVAGILRHRNAVTNYLTASFRVSQLVASHSTRLGAWLSRRMSVGEVSRIATTDRSAIGHLLDVSARFSGAVVSFFVVAALLLRTSISLGLIVLIGVPTLMALIAPLLRPLQHRVATQREQMGALSNTATDIVSGLRVLRGVGGEQVFERRYRAESQSVRRSGIQVARVQSVLDAAQVFLPGFFVVAVVWLGGRYSVEGTISPGDLVALFGFATFLILPLRTFVEYANVIIRGRVAARRICAFLSLEPGHPGGSMRPGADLTLSDPTSGVQITPGSLVALVSEDPATSAEVIDRLGHFGAGPDLATLGGVVIDRLDRRALRETVLVCDTGAHLFSGPLSQVLDPHGRGGVAEALKIASATDIIDSLPEGLDTVIAERGRNLSGGQRQRLVLARALVADSEVLLLAEPTSAVDAHTESRIAGALRGARAGRTTVVATSSPLMLDAVDHVVFLVDGRVAVTGRHRDLMATEPGYRRVVTREESAP